MPTLSGNFKLISKLQRRVVRHLAKGCWVLNLSPGPGVTVHMPARSGFQGYGHNIHHINRRPKIMVMGCAPRVLRHLRAVALQFKTKQTGLFAGWSWGDKNSPWYPKILN